MIHQIQINNAAPVSYIEHKTQNMQVSNTKTCQKPETW